MEADIGGGGETPLRSLIQDQIPIASVANLKGNPGGAEREFKVSIEGVAGDEFALEGNENLALGECDIPDGCHDRGSRWLGFVETHGHRVAWRIGQRRRDAPHIGGQEIGYRRKGKEDCGEEFH
jgi:hypothetical protein